MRRVYGGCAPGQALGDGAQALGLGQADGQAGGQQFRGGQFLGEGPAAISRPRRGAGEQGVVACPRRVRGELGRSPRSAARVGAGAADPAADRPQVQRRGRGGSRGQQRGQPAGQRCGWLVADDGVGAVGDGAARGDDVPAGGPGVDVPPEPLALVPGGVPQGRAGWCGEVQVLSAASGADGERVPGPGLAVPLAEHGQDVRAVDHPGQRPRFGRGVAGRAWVRPGPPPPAPRGRWPPRRRRVRRPSRRGCAPGPRWPGPPIRGDRRRTVRCGDRRPHRAGRGTCCSARAETRASRARRRPGRPM